MKSKTKNIYMKSGNTYRIPSIKWCPQNDEFTSVSGA